MVFAKLAKSGKNEQFLTKSGQKWRKVTKK